MTDSRNTRRILLVLPIGTIALFWLTYRDALDPAASGSTVRVARIEAAQTAVESPLGADELSEFGAESVGQPKRPSRERLAARVRQADRLREVETALRDRRRTLDAHGGSAEAIEAIDRHLARLGRQRGRLESEPSPPDRSPNTGR